ncbi:MAG: hypothetical protein M3Q68_01255 [Actinomycetota bacterium]|nr:hypothetical protein [Actinomycetota bacterium]
MPVVGDPTNIDILTAAEAAAALPASGSITVDATKLAALTTAVSLMMDSACGPIVLRTVTGEEYDGGGGRIWLRQAPVSATATTTVMTVTEYSSGTAQVLGAEDLASATANDYRFVAQTGELSRRSSWYDSKFGSQRVVVTYQAGRFANTPAVAENFKQAARIILRHVWTLEQGFTSLGEDLVPFGAGYSVPRRAVDFIRGELQVPAFA